MLLLIYQQEFACTTAPLFVVDSMLFSPSSKYLLLTGERGISVLEMPMRWGKFAEYDGGSKSVICRYLKQGFLECSQIYSSFQSSVIQSQSNHSQTKAVNNAMKQ